MDRDELTPEQEEVRELPEKDESVWAENPTEEDVAEVIDQLSLEIRDLDIRVIKLERGNKE